MTLLHFTNSVTGLKFEVEADTPLAANIAKNEHMRLVDEEDKPRGKGKRSAPTEPEVTEASVEPTDE